MVTGSVLDLHPSDRVCRPFPGERERRAATRLFTLNGLRPRAKLLIVTHAGSPARTRACLRSVVPGFEEAAGRIETSVGSRPDRGGRASAGERAGFQGYPGLYALLDVSWGVRDPPGRWR